MRVMEQALGGKQYTTRNVNNAAGKGDLGWDGVERFPGGKPVEPEPPKEKKGLFGKKKGAKTAPKTRDKWAGFEDAWEEDPEEEKKRNARKGGSKPGYKDGKKSIFSTKKAEPKPTANKDKMMGEDPEANKAATTYNSKDGDREYMWDDGRGMGGFGSGEQWGAGAKQHEGEAQGASVLVCSHLRVQESTPPEDRILPTETTGNESNDKERKERKGPTRLRVQEGKSQTSKPEKRKSFVDGGAGAARPRGAGAADGVAGGQQRASVGGHCDHASWRD